MRDLKIDKNKACAFTGHRTIYKDFDYDFLKMRVEQIIERGYDTFLVGMAVGFDTICFKLLEEIRKQKKIKIIACIPCANQSLKFSDEQKKEYKRMVSSADKKIILNKEYTPTCMQERNQYMVDNSSVLVAYIKRDYGGTANTVRYAMKSNVPIVRVK